MNWTSIGSIAIVTVLYISTASGYLWHGRPAMALVFTGYVIGNVGFIWDAWK